MGAESCGVRRAMPFEFRSPDRVPSHGDEDYDHNSPLALMQATEQRTRDYFVAVEVAKIAREKVRTCYRTETVNHTQNCADLVADYMKKSNAVIKLQKNQFKTSEDDE